MDSNIACSPAHVVVARPVLLLLAILAAVLGLVLAAGGIYLGFFSRLAETQMVLFGNSIRSTSVGVAIAFLGAVVFGYATSRILKTLHALAAL